MIKYSTVLTVLTIVILSVGCSKEISEDELPERKNFAEGVIELGVYRNDIDLSFLFDKIDFSKENTKHQFDSLLDEYPDQKRLYNELSEMRAASDPTYMIPLMSARNVTLYLKGEDFTVDVQGLGWEMQQQFDFTNKKGNRYMRTFIPEDRFFYDTELSTAIDPSEYLNALAATDEMYKTAYTRQISSQKTEVSGYNCDVVTYTIRPDFNPNPPGAEYALIAKKIVAYTTPAIPANLRLAFPIALSETNAILKLEAYYKEDGKPTFVVQPKRIERRTVTANEMKVDLKEPIYNPNDVEALMATTPIMYSGLLDLGLLFL